MSQHLSLSDWLARSVCRGIRGSLPMILCWGLMPALLGDAQVSTTRSQQQQQDALRPHTFDSLYVDSSDGYSAQIEEERRLRVFNAERQKKLVADTNKLLKLAAELNTELSGSASSTLTSAQLHKLGEMEKLAHSVREKMSSPSWGVPDTSHSWSAESR